MQKGFTPHLKTESIKKAKGCQSLGAGFTLFEILIAMAILSGIVLAISSFGLDIFDFSIFLGENITSQQELQLTLRVMIPEIRTMAPSANGAYPIQTVSQNTIIFYSDIDADGVTERIRYFLDGNVFKKGVIKATGNPLAYSGTESIREVVHNVYPFAGNIFAYYGSNYSGTQAELGFPVNIPSVRLIKTNLTVDPNPLDTSSRVGFYSEVNIRNL